MGPGGEGTVCKEAIRKSFGEVLEGYLTCLQRKFELVVLAAKRNGLENGGIGASVPVMSAQQVFLCCHQAEESVL